MIASLIDFSFIRSLVAHRYSPFGPPCYDPPSLFLLDLFRYVDGYQNMNKFLSLLHDEDRGRAYRTYTGISMNHIPSPGTFSHFRLYLGENLYNEIFHVLVEIFYQLEMITFKILAHDGTLYPTWARYKGCTYFCHQCHAITVPNVISRVHPAEIGNSTAPYLKNIRIKTEFGQPHSISIVPSGKFHRVKKPNPLSP